MALTKLSTDVIDLSDNTEALTIPKGATSNTPTTVEYLAVAGGGGTSNFNSGGGGAGGLLNASITMNDSITYTIVIGEGGALNNNTDPVPATSNGEDSTLNGSDITLVTVTGGGKSGVRGTASNNAGGDGGSGGGGGSISSGGSAPGAGNTPSTSPSQGFAGGVGADGGAYRGGGGGGAGAAGGSSASGGTGGVGVDKVTIINTINAALASVGEVSGSAVYFAGGGGAGANSSAGSGGLGGGGNGGTSSPAGQGTEGTGGGGGGGSYPTALNAAKGGRGVVILRYDTTRTATTSGFTAEAGPYTEGSYKVLVLKEGTGTVIFSGETTTGRPSSPTEGLMRENTTTSKMEFYDGSLWQEITDTASTYTPPAGIIPSANFNSVIYSNPGLSTPISVGFGPDMVLFKERNGTSSWQLYDTVRGDDYAFFTNLTDGQYNYSTHPNGDLSPTITSTGFTTPPVANGGINSSSNFVSYSWKAGGAATTISGVGTVNSDVSANTAAGFSIVKYTGNDTSNTTVAHGLGGIPELIIVKEITAIRDWGVYCENIGNTGGLRINTSGAEYIREGWWNNTTPTNSVFTLGGSPQTDWYTTNQTGNDYIAYCWRSIPGYSKIGFYVGNGSTTGPEIYTGFKPAWLMTKPTTSGYWYILDNKRNTSNPRNTGLFPNDILAEITNSAYDVDFNDTGFQPKNNSIGFNTLGLTYIYMTFAE